MSEIKLVVKSTIGEPINGYSRVAVSMDLFKATAGYKPTLPYRDINDANGKNIRTFTIDGMDLYLKYNTDTERSIYIMKTEDAQKALDTHKLDFDVSMFEAIKSEQETVANV